MLSALLTAVPSADPPRRVPRLGDLPDEDPGAFWRSYFKANRPAAGSVQARVRELNEAGRHDHVVGLIEAALINGQSQPWMYEILALSMSAVGRPQAEVERVVLSLSDFGQADYDSICQSARYLLSFGRDEAALRMLKQAAAMAPARGDAYLLAIPAVERTQSYEDALWALPAALDELWGEGTEATRAKVRSLGLSMADRLKGAGRDEQAAKLRAAVTTAAAPDLEVVLEWDGDADLDLLVTDPGGETCDFANPVTSGDGRLLKDGFGPVSPEERYVCPKGFPGDYLIEVVSAGGVPVGGRATLTVRTRTADGVSERKTAVRVGGETPASVRVSLSEGRRDAPRPVSAAAAVKPRPRVRVAQADAPQRAGAAVGSVVQTVREGATLNAAGVVSADRRYVRLGLNPWFSSLVDVETFSFIGGP